MNCNDYLPLLSGHLDGENSPEEEQRLQAHLAQCASCRARLQAFERGDRLLRADTAVPPAGLTASILAAAAKTPQRPVKKPRRAYWGGLATGLAAAALVVFTLLGPLKGFAQQKSNDTAATAAPGDVVMGYSGNVTSFYHDAATSGVEAPECKAADTDDAAAAYDGTAAEPLLVVLKGAHADVLPESSEQLSSKERDSWSETAGLWPEDVRAAYRLPAEALPKLLADCSGIYAFTLSAPVKEAAECIILLAAED